MTKRSRRRDAELYVIDMARKVANEFKACGDNDCTVNLQLHLEEALRHLDAIDLEPPDAARTGDDNPNLTSTMAGEWMQKHAADLAGAVFEQIYFAYGYGWEGLTTEQIENRLGNSHQTISPRVTELRDKGFIRDSGLKRPNRSGRTAIVWTPTSVAIRARLQTGELGRER